jgi:hypothetical protein
LACAGPTVNLFMNHSCFLREIQPFRTRSILVTSVTNIGVSWFISAVSSLPHLQGEPELASTACTHTHSTNTQHTHTAHTHSTHTQHTQKHTANTTTHTHTQDTQKTQKHTHKKHTQHIQHTQHTKTLDRKKERREQMSLRATLIGVQAVP